MDWRIQFHRIGNWIQFHTFLLHYRPAIWRCRPNFIFYYRRHVVSIRIRIHVDQSSRRSDSFGLWVAADENGVIRKFEFPRRDIRCICNATAQAMALCSFPCKRDWFRMNFACSANDCEWMLAEWWRACCNVILLIQLAHTLCVLRVRSIRVLSGDSNRGIESIDPNFIALFVSKRPANFYIITNPSKRDYYF